MSLIFEYGDIIQSMYEFFNQYISDISFFACDHVYVTDDIENDALLFFDKPDKDIAKNSNGLTILPNEIVEDLIVLINIPSEVSVLNINTIIHEFTHVYDIHQFAHEYTEDNLELIENHNMYLAYRHWWNLKQVLTVRFIVIGIVISYLIQII